MKVALLDGHRYEFIRQKRGVRKMISEALFLLAQSFGKGILFPKNGRGSLCVAIGMPGLAVIPLGGKDLSVINWSHSFLGCLHEFACLFALALWKQ